MEIKPELVPEELPQYYPKYKADDKGIWSCRWVENPEGAKTNSLPGTPNLGPTHCFGGNPFPQSPFDDDIF